MAIADLLFYSSCNRSAFHTPILNDHRIFLLGEGLPIRNQSLSALFPAGYVDRNFECSSTNGDPVTNIDRNISDDHPVEKVRLPSKPSENLVPIYHAMHGVFHQYQNDQTIDPDDNKPKCGDQFYWLLNSGRIEL